MKRTPSNAIKSMLLISTSNMHGLTDSLKTGFDGLRTICYIDHPEPLESSGGNFARIIFKFNMRHIICLTNQVIAVQPPDLILNLSYHLKIGNQLLVPWNWVSIKLETYLEMININYYNLWIEPVSEWVPKIGLTVGWLHPRYEIFRKYRSC